MSSRHSNINRYGNTKEIDGKPRLFTQKELELLPDVVVVLFLIELQRGGISLDIKNIQISPQSQKIPNESDKMRVTGFTYEVQTPDPERLKLDKIDSCFARAVQQALLKFSETKTPSAKE